MHGIKVPMAKKYIDNLSEEARKGMIANAAEGSGLRVHRWTTSTWTAPTASGPSRPTLARIFHAPLAKSR
jgi:hypothetical protein